MHLRVHILKEDTITCGINTKSLHGPLRCSSVVHIYRMVEGHETTGLMQQSAELRDNMLGFFLASAYPV